MTLRLIFIKVVRMVHGKLRRQSDPADSSMCDQKLWLQINVCIKVSS